MKHLILSLFIFAFVCSSLSAKTVTCSTCSQDDFEHAYYVDSAPGDTIVLPAGSATWGNSSRNNGGIIYIITNVIVQGQGDSTVINLDPSAGVFNNGVIALWAAATFKSMKFVQPNSRPITTFQISAYNNTTTGINFTGGFRITDITFIGGTGESGSGGYFAFIDASISTGGLIDHCSFTGNAGNTELIFGRGPNDSWQNPPTFGNANNIFIENCTFNNDGYVCDANSNAHFVIRYNTITAGMKVDGHGVCTNSPARSVRNMEIYHNTWTDSSNVSASFEIRGGEFRIFENTTSNSLSTSSWFFLTDYGYLTPSPNFGYVYQVPNDYYPIKDQIGVGQDPISAHSAPSYLWGNTKNGSAWPRAEKDIQIYTTTTDGTGYPIGTTVITLATMPVDYYGGNAIAFAGDSNRYFLSSGIYARSTGPTTITLVSPGLLKAIPAVATTATMGASTSYQARSGNPNAVMSDHVAIQSNREFFADAGFDTNTGVQRGTKAAMLAYTPSIVGYGWWVTDEGSWDTTKAANTSGQLYTWNGSAWVLKYTPYTYPHPLTDMIAPHGATTKTVATP